jgi:hypothetical protein
MEKTIKIASYEIYTYITMNYIKGGDERDAYPEIFEP